MNTLQNIIDLQKLLAHDNITLDSDNLEGILTERISEIMRRQEIIASFTCLPQPMKGKDNRFYFRPFKGDRTSFKGKTKEECIEKAVAYAKAKLERLTLSECLAKYIEYRKADLSSSTLHHYECDMKRFANELLDKPISSITSDELVLAFRNKVADESITLKAANNYKGVLRRVYIYAKDSLNQNTIDIEKALLEMNDTNKNLFTRKTQALLTEKPDDAYTPDEIKAFIAQCLQNADTVSLACLLLLYTGLRIGELIALHKDDIDLVKGTISVKRSIHKLPAGDKKWSQVEGLPKCSKIRVVVLPTEGIKLLTALLARAEALNPKSEYLFPSDGTKASTPFMNAYQVYRKLKAICKSMSIKTKSAHDLRRTYISLLDDYGVPASIRYMLVGHELEGINKHYVRNLSDISTIRKYLDNAFASVA